MHRIVNGQRVECSAEEEQKILDEWAENELNIAKEREDYQGKKRVRDQHLASIRNKLKPQFTDEEIDLLLPMTAK